MPNRLFRKVRIDKITQDDRLLANKMTRSLIDQRAYLPMPQLLSGAYIHFAALIGAEEIADTDVRLPKQHTLEWDFSAGCRVNGCSFEQTGGSGNGQ